ncbi:E3 ubiquitin-protein ligase RZFP34 [Sesamum alatum]|uniref:E3 ubiquitin-protein ligase RZFP34 n=1 Tax=Sesamum alatum TaxID=300844 RepID=A0AAE1Z3G5_9LAMI|nr:E3 ubiquitin-protein ligase RZFP34 [Sesamum alatum]
MSQSDQQNPSIVVSDDSSEEQLQTELASVNYGCKHYRRRCKIRAPCCDEVFDCRHCHNEAKNALEIDPLRRHDVPRHHVKRVICSLCDTEQDVAQNCVSCGVCMGNYFCDKCKFFDDDVSKKQYHCDECGICRTGGRENFFHCSKCGCCYSNLIKDAHRCVERAMHHNCAVCFEFLFDSTRNIAVLSCGHTIHMECVKEMERHRRYACPVCSKSICDMSNVWRKLDEEIASTPMPEMYKNKTVWILCNDCEETSEVQFHIVGYKCLRCSSYNTRQIQGGGPPSSCSSSRVAEVVR